MYQKVCCTCKVVVLTHAAVANLGKKWARERTGACEGVPSACYAVYAVAIAVAAFLDLIVLLY